MPGQCWNYHTTTSTKIPLNIKQQNCMKKNICSTHVHSSRDYRHRGAATANATPRAPAPPRAQGNLNDSSLIVINDIRTNRTWSWPVAELAQSNRNSTSHEYLLNVIICRNPPVELNRRILILFQSRSKVAETWKPVTEQWFNLYHKCINCSNSIYVLSQATKAHGDLLIQRPGPTSSCAKAQEMTQTKERAVTAQSGIYVQPMYSH